MAGGRLATRCCTKARERRKSPYIALETDFDPAAVWRRYRGRALFAFGGNDDSTPGALALERVHAWGNPSIATAWSASAQHLGLVARDRCHADLDAVSEFDRDYWAKIEAWIASVARR